MTSPSFRMLHVPANLHVAMLAQAAAELPNECCGLFGGRIVGGEAWVEERYPLVNAAASPIEFVSDDKDMFAAVRDMLRRDIEMLAIYHSHPTTHAVPSRTDLARNLSPAVLNLIISLMAEPAVVRAWWLREHDYDEAEWRITE